MSPIFVWGAWPVTCRAGRWRSCRGSPASAQLEAGPSLAKYLYSHWRPPPAQRGRTQHQDPRSIYSHLHDIKWTCCSKCNMFSVALYFHPIDGMCCGEGVTILIFMYHVLCSSLCNFKYATFKVDDKVCDKIANLDRDMWQQRDISNHSTAHHTLSQDSDKYFCSLLNIIFIKHKHVG